MTNQQLLSLNASIIASGLIQDTPDPSSEKEKEIADLSLRIAKDIMQEAMDIEIEEAATIWHFGGLGPICGTIFTGKWILDWDKVTCEECLKRRFQQTE